jgi:hypothetical protein
MAYFDHEDKQAIVFHGIDDTIVSDPKAVELIDATEFFRSMRAWRGYKGVDS